MYSINYLFEDVITEICKSCENVCITMKIDLITECIELMIKKGVKEGAPL